MDYKTFFNEIPPFRDKMGHDGILALLHELEDFHLDLNVIHIAGTNGKGSSAKMLSAIYKESGYTTGCFTSPYIMDIRECIFINEEIISEEFINQVALKVKKAYDLLVKRHSPLPTHYETITVTALLAMSLKSANICIIETLMGGLNDATNIFPHPLITLITNIGMDHTEYLGNTLADIAYHKSGIIKKQVPLVYNRLEEDAYKVVLDTASIKNAPMYHSQIYVHNYFSNEILTSFMDNLTLKGDHQRENLYGVLTIVDLLSNQFPISSSYPPSASLTDYQDTIASALLTVSHPNRLEIVKLNQRTIVFDGAHNKDGMEALKRFMSTFKDQPLQIIVGILKDKDINMMLSYLEPLADRFILTEPLNKRKAEASTLYEHLSGIGKSKAILEADYKNTVKHIFEAPKNTITLICGSLYLCTPLKEEILKFNKN